MAAFRDLTGRTFGRLTVKRLLSHNPVMWECECACGNVVPTESSNLKKNTKSCGCLKREICGNRTRKRPFEWLYNQHIVKRKAWIDLTYEEFLWFTEAKDCHYCGIALVWNEHRTKGAAAATNLDRKDNNVGYTKDNLVPCCFRCNAIKSTRLTYEEMVEIGKTLRLMRERKLAAAAGNA